MKLTMIKKISVGLLASAVMLSTSVAQASGFYLSNQGARASGRSNAVVASPGDASTIWYNPAGLATLDGKFQLYLGSAFIAPNYSFVPEGGGERTHDDVGILPAPHAYLGAKVLPFLALGVGFNASYGATVKWGEDSPGRTVVREQSLRTLWFQPTASVDFSTLGVKGLSIGATLDLVYATAYLTRDIAFGNNTYGSVALDGNDFRVGGHFGVLYRPEFIPGLSLGARYQLPIRTRLTGSDNVDFDAPASVRGLLPPDGSGSVDGVDIPQQVVIGGAYKFVQMLELEVDAIWNDWSDFERLLFTFPDGSTSTSVRQYEDRWGVRTGLELDLGVVVPRVGYEYDPTPIPRESLDHTLPDIVRNIVTAGVTVRPSCHWWIDAGGWYLLPKSRETLDTPSARQPVVGTFRTSAWVASLSVGMAFGQENDCGAAKPAEPMVTDAPLRDSDSDGVPDASDACPTVAGNDGTGCPAPVDADSDGVMDNVDKCPGVTGVAPDGCPPADPDKDGVTGDADACPNEAGDMPNGCPNPDPDGDGIQGAADTCPKEPETKNGFQDTDGCPDELPAAVAKFNGKLEGVKFATASSRLTKDSYATLDNIAKTLVEYPELKLEISGHTDNVGNAEKNLVLSQGRADSVKKYLAGKGVAAERLTAIGYGSDKPVADNATKEGQAANRRIEFKILTN